ncbi:MAG TPA: cupin domain-containing protein [Metabacillus sp.]|nr:cupin domain-containing protein [Metabacillus sp.]
MIHSNHCLASLSGKIDQIYTDGKEYESNEGDIVLINSNSIHSFSVTTGKNRRAVTIFIRYEFMKAIYENYDQIVAITIKRNCCTLL